MPEYDFKCSKCDAVFTEIHKIDECPKSIKCFFCGGEAPKIILFRGGLQTDHPAWINDHLRSVLQKEGEKPIETRGEHDAYLKKNNIVQRG